MSSIGTERVRTDGATAVSDPASKPIEMVHEPQKFVLAPARLGASGFATWHGRDVNPGHATGQIYVLAAAVPTHFYRGPQRRGGASEFQWTLPQIPAPTCPEVE